MALRARYGPGNRAWSYQRPSDDSTNGPPLLPSAFGLALSADEHTPVPDARPDPQAPFTTPQNPPRTAAAASKARARSDAGASSTAAARAARAAKTTAARNVRLSSGGGAMPASASDTDAQPRRRSGRVPAPATRARAASPTHTAAVGRTTKRKRGSLAADAALEAEPEADLALQALRDGMLPPLEDGPTATESDGGATRPTRGKTVKRPRVSQTDLDIKPPRPDDGDESKRTTFGSTTIAPDPFTSLSADWTPTQEQIAQPLLESAAAQESADSPRLRKLPPSVPVHHILKGLYRRYPVSQVGLPKEVIADVPDLDKAVALPPTTIPNAAPFLNLYAPRRTRGIGADKHGLCPICAEPPSRGGRGKATMLNMKTSAFNYHMQYVHGLSPKTGLPFSPPIAFRAAPRKTVGAREKATLEEGLCHACARWIVIEGVKAVDVLVPEIYWWKHASTCHKSRMLDGESEFYIEDPLFMRIVQWQRDHPATAGREHTRAGSAGGAGKMEAMDVDMSVISGAGGSGSVGGGGMSGAGGMGSARQGAVTPVRRGLEDPDSSPLSSLDGTDGISPIAVRKTSAPALQFPPTARGPFAPSSPSVARARSAEAGLNGLPFGLAYPIAHGQAEGQYSSPALPHGLGTPQVTNHALPGTLPGTPMTTASPTPLLTGGALPGLSVGSDHESSTHDLQVAEGEDEDAEGEDDPTATAENTPVLAQLPMLAPTLGLGMDVAGGVVAPSAQSAEQVQAPVLDVVQGQAPNVEMQAPEENVRTQAPPAEMQAPQVEMQVPQTGMLASQTEMQAPQTEVTVPHVDSTSMPSILATATLPELAPSLPSIIEPIPESLGEQAQAYIPHMQQTGALAQVPAPTAINELPPTQENPTVAEAPQDPITFDNLTPAPLPEAQTVQVPSVPIELANIGEATVSRAGSNELPTIQGMDMYARNATPDEPENPQLVLTDEDLALAGSDLALASAELDALAGAEMSLVGAELEMPVNMDLADIVGLGVEAQPVEPQQGAQNLGVPPQAAEGFNSSLGLSSGEGTPNAGGEPDMFAFWDAR